ncbi:glycosyltransferase family 4 protein [Desulfatirhabdium butyrativorans]|uniref:glycosyltransferase family 4 protein n=1 Tax=Desulfatirhabdium butyrativorans TaxID=340467 RepID=UPI00040F5238|nr:glycosyltransferase family 4 protein [Desulfatirhabdium butyrativorans]
MHVVLFTNAFPNAVEPQRGAFTLQIARAMKDLTDVDVVAPLPFAPKWTARRHPIAGVAAVEEIEGLCVHHPRYLVLPKIAGATHAATLALAALPMIRAIQRQHRIDLINAHWIYPDGVAAVWIGRRMGIPVYLTALGCDINAYPKMKLRKPQIVWALRHARGLGAVSRNLADGMAALLQERHGRNGIRPERGGKKPDIRVIPNGVDGHRFFPLPAIEARNRLGLEPEGPVVLTVGSQDEVKGTRYLIEAVAMLEEVPGLRLVLVGDGPLRGRLERLGEALGISGRVRFAGKRDHAEIPLWMNAADVFCLPSLREGHPNVVMEALACGIPVVASDVGAVSEVLRPEAGIVVPPADAAALARALRSALQRNWGRDTIRNTVCGASWEACARNYIHWYREMR